ncbi:MAG: pilus assembly protein TadG-related protein [Verrucomicrobiota bacterium]|nr:pilus assembly protein TadG-related protein [Verrucomicrobiota bacterium]
MPTPPPRKSGQAIIFLMVVMVIGILAVVWNFDLHRVVSAKLRMRNAGDAAALAAARWQGHALNMIGDLNLIQAALFADNYDPTNGVPPEIIQEAEGLHELRQRLEFVGPLAAFAVAQQTAFNNGALPDPVLASNLVELAEDLRYKIDEQPYDNAFKDYADLLDNLAVRGVAVSSYGIDWSGDQEDHPLVQETFYAAIAEAVAGWWCPMHDHRHLLENYEDFGSWGKLDTEFEHRPMFDLQLDDEYSVELPSLSPPFSAVIQDPDTYWYSALYDYLNSNDVVDAQGNGAYVIDAVLDADTAEWHVYDNSWTDPWPRPAEYDDETDPIKLDPLAIRDPVKGRYNYLGAVAGIGMSAKVGRGILSSSDNETVDLSYKAKAKVFGFLDVDGEPPQPVNYFGFVFPCFEDVRLVHSDIGDKVLGGVFYEHVTKHLEPYLDGGPDACNAQCPYCRLLVAWENLDRKKGLEWLDRAYNDDHDNPCEPDIEGEDFPWGDDGGGATGGS